MPAAHTTPRPGPRDRATRRHDTARRLAHEVDAWVATASPAGVPHLVPLSFEWDGETLLFATTAAGPTGRNLGAGGEVRVGIGPTRDVTLVEGTVSTLALEELAGERADRFAEVTGFDPRAEAGDYRWYLVTPRAVRAWREADELAGRLLMREGRWLAPEGPTGPAGEEQR